MKFCSNCAAAVVKRVPPGDNLPRWVCDQCGEIHYQNPRMVVGAVPEYQGKILLCRRAIEPRYGYWTLPAGFMENDETAGQAALRETLEEAGARIELGAPFTGGHEKTTQRSMMSWAWTLKAPRARSANHSLSVVATVRKATSFHGMRASS